MRRELRSMLHSFWPRFSGTGPRNERTFTFSNYRRTWLLTIVALFAASFIPLGIAMLVDYGFNRREVEAEHALRVVRLASNAKRSIAHFLTERLDALAFTGREVGYRSLTNLEHLGEVLKNLKLGFGGVTDLGVIDRTGRQIAYRGPYDLLGKDYREQATFRECRRGGAFVSAVFRGHRDEPHIVVAVRCDRPGDSFFILRATVDIQRLVQTLESIKSGPRDDVFLVSRDGILQTPSRDYGEVLERSRIEVPPESQRTRSRLIVNASGKRVIVAHSGVSTGIATTPFVLVFVRDAEEMTTVVAELRANRILFFVLSMAGIFLAVLLTLTSMFNRLYEADREKARTILMLEQTSRLASLGRLAAGVAHEINNPLAVINEDAGYIHDVLTFPSVTRDDTDLLEHASSIVESVNRCRAITRQLLGLARKVEVKIGTVDVREAIEVVLSFHRKEAEHRSIALEVDVAEDAEEIVTDRGKLQQVLLNVVGNAFQVLENGGRLGVEVRSVPGSRVSIALSDTGCGIPPARLEKIFEPFFTTKSEGQGTGLGLAISYGLVRKLKGTMSVASEVGRGSTFTIVLPTRIEAEDGDEAPSGG